LGGSARGAALDRATERLLGGGKLARIGKLDFLGGGAGRYRPRWISGVIARYKCRALPPAINNPTFGQIVRGHFHGHGIAREDADVVFPHFP
jgi:hypothetical protein